MAVLRALKNLAFIALLVAAGYFVYRAYHYYAENARYAAHVWRSYRQRRAAPFANGYTDRVSYGPGDTLTLYLDFPGEDSAWVRLYDVRGRAVDSVRVGPSPQPDAPRDPAHGYGYRPTASYRVPERLPGGLYLWEYSVPCLLRGDPTAPVAVLYPSNTVQAYNVAGGLSFYRMFTRWGARLSFQRPTFPAVHFPAAAGLRWLAGGDTLRYLADTDLEGYDALRGAQLLIVVGHSEYWTRRARRHFDRFVAEGGQVLLLSGNTMWWQVRYEGGRLVCYKDGSDPAPDSLLTVNWFEPALGYPTLPSLGTDFRYGGYGRKYAQNEGGFVVTDTAHPVFAGVRWGQKPFLTVPTKEYDGAPLVTDSGGVRLGALPTGSTGYLLGYDYARYGAREGFGAALVFRPAGARGTVLSFASMDWTSDYGLGGTDSLRLRRVTRNAIGWLLRGPE